MLRITKIKTSYNSRKKKCLVFFKYLFNGYLAFTFRKYLYFPGQGFLCKQNKAKTYLNSLKTVLSINITDETKKKNTLVSGNAGDKKIYSF